MSGLIRFIIQLVIIIVSGILRANRNRKTPDIKTLTGEAFEKATAEESAATKQTAKSQAEPRTLMDGFKLRRMILFWVIFTILGAVTCVILPALNLLFAEGVHRFLQNQLYSFGIATSDMALFDLSYHQLNDAVVSLFLPLLPFDFTGMRVREDDLFLLLPLALFGPLIAVGLTRHLHLASAGLHHEDPQKAIKRGMPGLAWSNRAFFRVLPYGLLVMMVLYLWAGLQRMPPSVKAYEEPYLAVLDMMTAPLGGPFPAALIVTIAIFIGFYLLVARAQNIALLPVFTILFFGLSALFSWLMTDFLRAGGVNLPYYARNIEAVPALLPFSAGFLACFLIATLLSGLFMRAMDSAPRRQASAMPRRSRTSQQSTSNPARPITKPSDGRGKKSPHWIKGR